MGNGAEADSYTLRRFLQAVVPKPNGIVIADQK